ncbi:MAG: M3 family oligoendopeptidase [Deltaproteobacteria bacterium]|nr:M3 family oligoendopeptidase [Deltaproteobacteria bacterium]MBW2359711.1 M3 family oligoendopeptidase [Deltaproteobacteria bacterium]
MSSFAAFYQRPDLEAHAAAERAMAGRVAAADSAETFLAAVQKWNEARATLDTHAQIASVRYSQCTTDESAKAEQDFWDESAATLRELEVLHAKTLLDSEYRNTLDEAYGPQFLALKKCLATTFIDEIRADVAEEAKLKSRYVELLAKPDVSFRGNTYSLSELIKFYDHADRDTRREAQQARDAFLGSHAEELDSIYDQLTTLRDRMGRALGHDSYTPVGYQLMTRASYGPDEVAAFRDAIYEHFLPIANRLHGMQAKRLGLDALQFHDEPLWDAEGNPRPEGDAAFVVDRAKTMYSEVHPKLGEFMKLMDDRGLLDLELRDGKAGGGFCANFHDLGVPFVFANFNGSDGDIMVITHELGHAFQCYTSRHHEPRMEYAFPTYEACEVHSMSMEFLTYPWMHLFFGDEGGKAYRRSHFERAVAGLSYLTCVDHFQHDVYAEPGMSPADRNARWLEHEARYLPHRDYGGQFPYLQSGTFWQRQRHIYLMPFYYIDYALAQVCALQFWMRAQEDHDKALADYMAICEVGGSVSFGEMLEAGNVRSPFDADALADIARRISHSLELD